MIQPLQFFKRALVCFGLIGCATPAFATVKITGVTGASTVTDLTGTITPIISGGSVGSTVKCTDTASTCNTCTEDKGSGTGPTACNPAAILKTTTLSITVTSDKVGGTLIITDSAGAQVNINPIQTVVVSAGGSGTFSVAWSTVCPVLKGAGATNGTNDADCTTDSTGSFLIGVDADGSGSLGTSTGGTTGASDESAPFTIKLTHDMPNLVNESSGTAQETKGIYSFSVVPGDEKVYVKSLAALPGFGQLLNSTVSAIRFYYEPVAAGVTCAAAAPQVRNSSSYVETTFTNETANNPTLDEDRIRGLTNNQRYVFKAAVRDNTGNIGLFTPDAYCSALNDDGSTDGTGDHGYHIATPDEVIGILTEQKNCFIATAAFGSPLEPHVQTFRDFRDRYLLKTRWSRELVRFYYNHGPQWAKVIAQSETLRAGARGALWPIWVYAFLCNQLGIALGSFLSLLSIVLLFTFTRRILKVKSSSATRGES